MKIYKFKLANLNPGRFDLLPQYQLLKLNWLDGVILAGGALQTVVNRDLAVNDLDLFFTKAAVVPVVVQILEDAGYKRTYLSPCRRLVTYKRDGLPKIQIILKTIYNDVETLLKSFDLTACMWACDSKYLYTTKEAISHTKKQLIRFNNVQYPASTLNRIAKYQYVKNFKIDQETYIDFFNQINIDIRKYNMNLFFSSYDNHDE